MSDAFDVRTHCLVELRNYAHLAAAYGDDFAAAAMRKLQLCTHLWGGSVFVIGSDCFLVSLAQLPHEERPLIALIERWQCALFMTALNFGGVTALPAVTVEAVSVSSVGLTDGCLRYPDELERHVAPLSLPPVCYGKRWALSYERDMEVALTFYRALAQGQANLVFQPIVQHGAPSSVLYQEALVRLDTGLSQSNSGPAQVVHVLERLGLVRVLDHAVMMAVVKRLEIDPFIQLGCNISAQSLSSDALWESLIERLVINPDVAARLTLEITETAPLSNFDAACIFVRRLQKTGCRIALDDFGVGHSSLAFANAINPHVIKIDSTYVHAARSDLSAADRLRKLVAFCQTLAPYVVAEGIESADDIELAAVANIRWLQGYCIERPHPLKPQVDLCVFYEKETALWGGAYEFL
ncbi:EAL domain-containing protein [Pseudomonas sp. FP2309]|uniref:EAL domain-containing protein n=1 Tax=Pseudomonas sp. FP2309 TaxID=2954091 RepID=UPI0027331113|nr:EAL domain-containing protein [Pseudomonas sp. FP2309]WLH66895.1 EAL domain-containing protein [Pseudomonas sp. FP2309]